MPGPRTRTALILSDWQCDLHDQQFIDRTLVLAKDLQPDKIVHVGDETDATTISRWVRDTPAEVEGNLQRQIDITSANLLRFRETCPRADFSILYSNHLERFSHAVRTRLPGFRTLRALTVESLFGLEDLAIRYERKLVEVFPGVIGAHGHQFGLTSSNQYQRGTAWAHKLGASIVAGHTHRPMLTSIMTGTVSSATTRFYLNVGCSMDFTEAEYIMSKSPEWGHGAGILEYNSRTGWIQPHLITAHDGRFRWEGKWY